MKTETNQELLFAIFIVMVMSLIASFFLPLVEPEFKIYKQECKRGIEEGLKKLDKYKKLNQTKQEDAKWQIKKKYLI